MRMMWFWSDGGIAYAVTNLGGRFFTTEGTENTEGGFGLGAGVDACGAVYHESRESNEWGLGLWVFGGEFLVLFLF